MKTTLLIILIIITVNFTVFSQTDRPPIDIYSYFTNFEENSSDSLGITDTINPWVINTANPENIWQIGSPSKVYFDSAYSAPYAIVTDTINNYPPNNHSTFEFNIIKPLPWLCWSNMIIDFMHKYDTDTLHDGGYIDISYDGGATWTNIIFDEHENVYIQDNGNFYSEEDTILGGIPAFSGKSNGWITTQFEWGWNDQDAPYVDSAIVRFNFISDSINSGKEGWMIDNIDFDLSHYCNIGIEGIENIEITSRIYPNPVADVSVLEYENCNNSIYTFEVFDMYGRKVKGSTEIYGNTIEIHRNDYSPGLYIYRLYNKYQNITGKFIVK